MSKALLKYIRLSPIKARLIAREIQGMNAELALATLEFAPNKAARVIYKVLASAVANGNYDAQSVIVKSCRIDTGPVLRRMSPRARGRANMIRKPTAHILVEVATESEIAKAKEVAKAIKSKKENAKKESTKTKKVAETSNESKKAITKAPKKEVVKAESTKAQKPKSASKDSQDSQVSKDSKATKPKAPKESSAEKATKKTSATKTKATKNKDEDK